jgi:hypothetical protein
VGDVSEHPLQYAFVTGLGSPDPIVYDTEQMDDDRVLDALYGKVPANVDHMLRHRAAYRVSIRVERYNRCPTCEQWSPCDVRKASTGGAA